MADVWAIRKPPLAKVQTVLGKQKIKYNEERFSIWRMEIFHPAMWHVTLGWHAIEFVQTSAILKFYFDHITAVHTSFCASQFYPNRTAHGRKMTSCQCLRWRISAILDFRGPIIDSLKSPCTTSYRSSIETIALNWLVFEEIAFLHFGDKLTNRQTDGQAHRIKPLSLSWSAA